MTVNANSANIYPGNFSPGLGETNRPAEPQAEVLGFVGPVASETWQYIGGDLAHPDTVVATARGVLRSFTMGFGHLGPQVTQLAKDTAWGTTFEQEDVIRRAGTKPILVIEKPNKTGRVFDARGNTVTEYELTSNSGEHKLVRLSGGSLNMGLLSAEEGDVIQAFWEIPGAARVMQRTLPQGIGVGHTNEKNAMASDGRGALRADYEQLADALRKYRHRGPIGAMRRILDVAGAIAGPRPRYYSK